MNNKEMIRWLKWLINDEDCADTDKLPKWAKENIIEVINGLNDINQKSEVEG